jgi:hypothetical protein
MEFLAMLAIIGVVIFYKLTTATDRARWGWNIVAFVCLSGLLGLVYTILKTGSIPE